MNDLLNILDSYRIPYVNKGANVSTDSVGIKCPFCMEDPSEHLNLNIGNAEKYGWFYCWRCQTGGRFPHKFLMKIMSWTYSKTKLVLGDTSTQVVKDGEFDTLVANLNSPSLIAIKEDNKRLFFPEEFQPLRVDAPSRFINYLSTRGFLLADIIKIGKKYKLRYATTGEYRDRLIFPVFLHQKLITWTARSILPTEKIRYKTLSRELSKEVTSNLLLNYDSLRNPKKADTLVVVEGPFDFLKLDWYGDGKIKVTCLFKKQSSIEQQLLLLELSEKYEKIVILLDKTEFGASLELKQALASASCPVHIGTLKGVEDPGDLSPLGVRRLLHKNFFLFEMINRD